MKKTSQQRGSKVSNNVLFVLILTAIGFSVLSTFASLSYLGIFTGAASTGTVSLNDTNTTSCRTDAGDGDNAIAFGNRAAGAVVDSDTILDWFAIENNGNVNLTVEAYVSDNLWDVSTYQAPSLYFQVECNNTQSGNSCNTEYENLNATQGTANDIVANLGALDSVDVVYSGVNVTVPSDEPGGPKSGTVTYYCTQT